MATFQRFEDIHVWKMARQLIVDIYAATHMPGFAKDFSLQDQIRRAAISVASNIAEGSERSSGKDFVKFLYIAKGSAAEVRSQLHTALDLRYITQEHFQYLYQNTNNIGKMLYGLISAIESHSEQH